VATQGGPVIDGQQAPRLLPHRYPFLLIDRVLELELDRRIVAVKNVTQNEPHFTGHFPDRPIMPGVLICEALAQAGGLLVHGTLAGGLSDPPRVEPPLLVLTGIENARFRRPVQPGDQLRLEVTLERRHRPLWKFRGVAKVGDQVVAQADLSAVEVDPEGVATGAVRSGRAPEPEVTVRIHPSAVVAPTAELDHGVQIEAFAWVGPSVKLGRGTVVMHHASVDGNTVAGAENRIFPYAQLGCLPQDLKYRGEEGQLLLGDRNQIREFATLSIGTAGGGFVTQLGDDNLLMNYSHVGHDSRIGNHAILANGVPLAGHVTVDDHAILSGLAAVAQFVRIGESAFVGGGSMVVMNVPPFCMANGDRAKLKGLNLVGLERRGFDAAEIKALKRGYRILFQSKLLVAEGVAQVRAELAESPRSLQLAAFVEESERGVTRP
jgi:UDP-N-acetylglucosamine acyltransferase